MRVITLFFLSLFLILNCSQRRVDEETDVVLYREGVKYLQDGVFLGISDPDSAIEKFEALIEKWPWSKYLPDAKLGIADAHYKKGEYSIAADYYDEFLKLYPSHSKVPYAMFMAGKSYYEILDSFDRDVSSVENAIRILSEFLRKYPDDENWEEANKILKECKRAVSKRYLYIAKYYLRRGLYMSAIPRLEAFKTFLSDTEEYDEAMKLLEEINRKLQGSER